MWCWMETSTNSPSSITQIYTQGHSPLEGEEATLSHGWQAAAEQFVPISHSKQELQSPNLMSVIIWRRQIWHMSKLEQSEPLWRVAYPNVSSSITISGQAGLKNKRGVSVSPFICFSNVFKLNNNNKIFAFELWGLNSDHPFLPPPFPLETSWVRFVQPSSCFNLKTKTLDAHSGICPCDASLQL